MFTCDLRMFTFVTKITLRHEKMVLMPCSFSCFLFNLFAITALRIRIGTICECSHRPGFPEIVHVSFLLTFQFPSAHMFPFVRNCICFLLLMFMFLFPFLHVQRKRKAKPRLRRNRGQCSSCRLVDSCATLNKSYSSEDAT